MRKLPDHLKEECSKRAQDLRKELSMSFFKVLESCGEDEGELVIMSTAILTAVAFTLKDLVHNIDHNEGHNEAVERICKFLKHGHELGSD